MKPTVENVPALCASPRASLALAAAKVVGVATPTIGVLLGLVELRVRPEAEDDAETEADETQPAGGIADVAERVRREGRRWIARSSTGDERDHDLRRWLVERDGERLVPRSLLHDELLLDSALRAFEHEGVDAGIDLDGATVQPARQVGAIDRDPERR